jgi:type I pantothenate kinase
MGTAMHAAILSPRELLPKRVSAVPRPHRDRLLQPCCSGSVWDKPGRSSRRDEPPLLTTTGGICHCLLRLALLRILSRESMSNVNALEGSDPMRRDTSAYFYDSFTRQQWARFDAGSYRLAPAALTLLKGINEPMPTSEVEEVIGPLCRLLDIQMETNHVRPFVIAVAGSVAVGKSTFARVLRALLAQAGRTVELVATDGFLWPTAILEKRNLMDRKGFPESYDLERMLGFLAELKAGRPALRVPVYSHEFYDIVPGQYQNINQPQILILEGLNVLQGASRDGAPVAADYFDFSVYLDADENDVELWYVERFSVLQRTVFQRPSSYFHHFKDLRPAEVTKTGQGIWRSINLPNLLQNIQPTRERASVILRKGQSHAVKEVLWRHSIDGGPLTARAPWSAQ